MILRSIQESSIFKEKVWHPRLASDALYSGVDPHRCGFDVPAYHP